MRRFMLWLFLVCLCALVPVRAGAQVALELYANNARTTLATGINNSTTTIVLTDASAFPSPTGGQYFWMTLSQGGTIEIVKCTAKSTNTLTCSRGEQSSGADSFTSGADIFSGLTAATLNEIRDEKAPLASPTFTGTLTAGLSQVSSLWAGDWNNDSPRNAKLQVFDINRAPGASAVWPLMTTVSSCHGDNTTFRGCMGHYIYTADDGSVTGSNKGVLYGLNVDVAPSQDRNNVPFDDVAGILISNVGTKKGTDALYFGHNAGIVGSEWISSITIDTFADYGLRFVGTNSIADVTGGNAAGSSLVLLSTEANGSGDSIVLKGGNAGATTFASFISTGATIGPGVLTLGTAGSTVGEVALKNATSGTLSLKPPTGALGTVTITVPAATDTLVAKATTDILTNKTIDTEGTGNVVTAPFKINYRAAVCQNSAAASGLDMGATAPQPTCITGTNTNLGALQYPDSDGNYDVQGSFALPSDWTGNLDLAGVYRGSGTSGNVVWQISTICVADAETVDPAFNTAQDITDAQKGTTLQLNDFSQATLTTTTCAAGETLFWRLRRQRTHASDTATGTLDLISLAFTFRRAL